MVEASVSEMVLMSPKIAAKKLGVSVKTLLGHAHDGSIRYVNVGRGERRQRYAFAEFRSGRI